MEQSHDQHADRAAGQRPNWLLASDRQRRPVIKKEINGLSQTQRGESTGSLDHPTTPVTARIMSAAICGAALEWSQQPDRVPMDEMALAIVKVLTRGVLPP